jgi:hypothetical protein
MPEREEPTKLKNEEKWSFKNIPKSKQKLNFMKMKTETILMFSFKSMKYKL